MSCSGRTAARALRGLFLGSFPLLPLLSISVAESSMIHPCNSDACGEVHVSFAFSCSYAQPRNCNSAFSPKRIYASSWDIFNILFILSVVDCQISNKITDPVFFIHRFGTLSFGTFHRAIGLKSCHLRDFAICCVTYPERLPGAPSRLWHLSCIFFGNS